MAISRAQLLKELLPGLNALFGLEYAKYGEEHAEIFETETSDRSFEEETKLSGFSAAPVKNEGSAIEYDNAQEAFTARYTHETVAMGFSITEEAIEDNLYDSLSARYTNSNEPATPADLNETSLEAAVIQIAGWTDERGLLIAAKPRKLVIPPNLQFVATRLLETEGRVGTADNDLNALRNNGSVPEGYTINHYLTDTDAFFLMTDVPNGLKHFTRSPMATSMDADFDTGNSRYKARERYSFGVSDPLGIFGSPGA
jgi:hypothetical protein